MDMIKKSDVIDSYYNDKYSGDEIISMIIYEEIPTIKAIPLSEIEQILKDHDEDDSWYIDKIREVINKWKKNT